MGRGRGMGRGSAGARLKGMNRGQCNGKVDRQGQCRGKIERYGH